MTKAVVTGGGGFIGSYLVRSLVMRGWDVVVIDNLARGRIERLADVMDRVDWRQGDVRDPALVKNASIGADVIFHLAAVNGTENFYTRPELVLDVGLRGALAAVEGGRDANVPHLVVASSAEVYQTPPTVPTDEHVPLTLPDSLNPRYSYGGSKIVSELIAFNYAQEHYRKVQVFRPHNVYGPDMGWKHVLPQFIVRAKQLVEQHPTGVVPFPIQGDGRETRAFCYVDDIVDGIITMYERGGHREIYHIGNPEEVSIVQLVDIIAAYFGREFELVTGELAEGGTRRRCPDIGKMAALGYTPSVALVEGVRRTADWYVANPQPSGNELL